MELLKERITMIEERKDLWSDSYRIQPKNEISEGMKECDIKPCRQIILLRYPKIN